MISLYNALFDDIEKSGITKIECNALFERYGSEFQNNYNLFKDFLLYLEDHKKIHIVRFDFDSNLFHSVEIL